MPSSIPDGHATYSPQHAVGANKYLQLSLCVLRFPKVEKTSLAVMKPDPFKRLGREAFRLGVREVGLYSRGEPFLCPDLEEYVKLCRDIGYEYIYLTTNGSLATPERLAALIANDIHSIKFSINAATRKNYELIHDHDYLDRVTEHIKAADTLRKRSQREIFWLFRVSCGHRLVFSCAHSWRAHERAGKAAR